MKIELGKTYRNTQGKKVRIICIDRKSNDYPIVGLVDNDAVNTYTVTGKYTTNGRDPYEDIVSEATEWDDVAIDTKVIVSDRCDDELRRYFAGIYNGKPSAFAYGATSWSDTTNDMTPQVWANMRLAP